MRFSMWLTELPIKKRVIRKYEGIEHSDIPEKAKVEIGFSRKNQ